MLPILYRDDRLIAIHKPAGLLVHRTPLDSLAEQFALQLLRDQIGQRVYPVHRLDKGTSGVLLFALDRDAGRQTAMAFEAQTVEKTYLAVVRGHPPEAGHIDYALKRQYDPYERTSRQDNEPQLAVTDYRRLATTELPFAVDRYPTSRYALMELHPQTGRRHQLRRHMSHIAHPIIGDATHGKGVHNRFFQQQFDCHRLLLACLEMTVPHPDDGRPLHLQAPLAEDFSRLVAALGWTAALPAAALP